MIKDIQKEDLEGIRTLWYQSHPEQQQEYIDFYFQNEFFKTHCIVCEQDGRIISSLAMKEHVMSFLNRKLLVSYLEGVATLPDYRRRGHMHELMNVALDEVSHNHLITLTRALNPKIFEPYGFETVCYHKFYMISRRHLDIGTSGVSHQYDIQELLDVYEEYTKHFDGCIQRDIAYYRRFVERSMLQNGNICVCRDAKGNLSGYAAYHRTDEQAEIHEIIYLDSASFMKLAAYVCGSEDEVSVQVSQAERIEMLFPLAIGKRQRFLMARINNYELFNKLFNTKAETVTEAFALMKKPIMNNEYY